MDFPAALASIMARRNLTQSALAAASGLRQGAISQWLRGANVPSLAAAITLADALGVSLDELSGRQPRRGKRSTPAAKSA